MAQHRAERLDIGRKPRFTPLTRPAVHSGPRSEKDRPKYSLLRSLSTQIPDVEFCDSVRLFNDLIHGPNAFRDVDYAYLLDGGLADNLGTRSLRSATIAPYDDAGVLRAINEGRSAAS